MAVRVRFFILIIMSTCFGAHGFLDFNDTLNYIPHFGTDIGSANAGDLKLLLDETMEYYDIRIRPRWNQSIPVRVNVTFTPNIVVSLDTTEQRLDVLGYFNVTWQDELLGWDVSAYYGINVIQLPLSQVWRPKLVLLKLDYLKNMESYYSRPGFGVASVQDLYLRNHAFHTNSIIGDEKMDTVVVVSRDLVATVTWVPEGIYSVLCELNVKYYPFDVQNCGLQFYVSDETFNTVHLEAGGEVSRDDYTENSEWKLLEINTLSFQKYNTNVIRIVFRLERRAEFTLYTIVVPLLLLSVLDVCGFLIPVESGEKISYMVTLFLTFSFFVFILRDGLPHNSLQVSYFLVYLLELSFISVGSVVYSIAETRLFQSRGEEEFDLFHNKVHAEDRRNHGKDTVLKDTGKDKPSCSNKTTNQGRVRSAILGNTSRSDRVDVMESGGKPGTKMTWSQFLRKLDIVMFAVVGVLVAIFTLFFFGTVLNR